MSNWTHPQCEACWIERELTVTHAGTIIRRPHRLVEPEIERCCFCGKFTIAGIYRRHDPAELSHCLGHEDGVRTFTGDDGSTWTDESGSWERE